MAETKHALQPSDYVHLHNHTQYSLLDGLTKVPALIDYVKDQGMVAVAQTDHGTMSGAIEFYKAATAQNIKPIIGMETYVAARTHLDKDPGKDKPNFHLILLAMNNEGYQNLMALSTTANLQGYYYKPRIDHALLEKHNAGLIVLSGCIGGEVGDAIRNDDYAKARQVAEWYKSIFGDRYYIEVQDHGHPDHPSKWDEQVRVNKGLLQLAEALDIKPVVTCDAHYLQHEDQEAHEILLCVQTGSFLSDEKRMSLKDFELHVTEPDKLIERWQSLSPQAIISSREIADRCEVTIELGKILIPKFPVPEGQTEKSYLVQQTYRGLVWRFTEVSEADAATLTVDKAKALLPEPVIERAEYELGVIESMGFNGYFLIIADFMNWGKDQGIVFGPGRGSAAGSIISYALKITELDPLKYDLLFERFLNPDRISMPDVDIDIMDTRRDEVIQYCSDKYGADRVANIVTFGTMAARNAVRDVARVLQVPYAEADRLAKMIPPPVQGRHIPLGTSLVKNAELKAEYENNEDSHKVFDLAVRVEGTIRSHGVHAAGVVIAPDSIVKFAPLEMAQKGVVSTQYSKDPVEELGLLKMDFLGLSNLTVINNTLRIVRRVYGKEIDINSLPLDDELTYKLLQRGDTTGVFQFESAGMKRYLRELKATEFDDVIAMGALYRPGPLSAGLTDSFIKRKNGLEDVSYAHPLMKGALETTFGVLVYQEQVMRVSRDVCGFTGGEADTLRKAIGKKKVDVMNKMQVQFVDGAVKNGVPKPVIEKFWKDLLGFADYCFNKSHSACYGMISYQTAYLKAHYPAAFMAALMTSDFDDTDRLAIEIAECKKMGIQVLSPDVNESFVEFAVVPDPEKPDNRYAPIRFGMNAIKNVGTGAVEEILRARNEVGKFEDLESFLNHVSPRIVNRKAMESLIKAGAFDRFDDRSKLLGNLDLILAFSQRLQKQANSGQIDLFGGGSDSMVQKAKLELTPPVETFDMRQQLLWERELLGLYLSQHPLEMFDAYLTEQCVPIKEIKPEHDGRTVCIGGTIVESREIVTKNGKKMAFVKLEDRSGELELILFPGPFQETLGLWERDRVVLIHGKVNAKDREGNRSDEVKIMVDNAREITVLQATSYQAAGKKPKPPKPVKVKHEPAAQQATPKDVKLYIRIEDSQDQTQLANLKEMLDAYRGTTEVVLVLGNADARQAIKLPTGINQESDGLFKLKELVGADNVRFQ